MFKYKKINECLDVDLEAMPTSIFLNDDDDADDSSVDKNRHAYDIIIKHFHWVFMMHVIKIVSAVLLIKHVLSSFVLLSFNFEGILVL